MKRALFAISAIAAFAASADVLRISVDPDASVGVVKPVNGVGQTIFACTELPSGLPKADRLFSVKLGAVTIS